MELLSLTWECVGSLVMAGGINGAYTKFSENPPDMRNLIQKEINNFYQIQPLGTPVKVKPPDDSDYFAALGYTA